MQIPFSVRDKSSNGDWTVVTSGYIEEDHLHIEEIIKYCPKHDIENCTECQMDEQIDEENDR